jgi:hypothetical protein
MDHTRPEPARQHERAQTALVLLLHRADAEHVALGLVRAWSPTVPTAILTTLRVAEEDGAEQAWKGVVGRLGQTGIDPSRLVLAGIGGAQQAALRLAFGPDALGCAGVLACGDIFLPLAALAGPSSPGRPKLRLVWTADDPLVSAAAPGDLLHCLRVAGLDAQGAVLPGAALRAAEAGSGPGALLVRLAGAYLAELVAVALGGASWPRGSPARTG